MSIKPRNLLIGLAVFGSAIYLSAASQPVVSSAVDRDVKRVKVAEVTVADSSREMSFAGVTRAARRARLSFFLGGRIVERPVEVGDRVRRGQVVARLDDLELRNAVAAARGALSELEARRAQAERDVERAQRLLDAKAATSEEVEKTRAGLEAVKAGEESAHARLKETERLLQEARLTAPFDGTVTEVFFEPGEVTTPGRPVVLLSGDGPVELEVEVPESVVPRISVGDAVTVVVPHRAEAPVSARISSVGRAAAGPGSLFPVLAVLQADGGEVAAGSTAELRLNLTTERALALPVEAVVDPGGRRPAVFRYLPATGRVEKIFVEVGSLIDRRVVVTGQLSEGDLVVVGGQRGLLDGDEVEVLKPVGGAAGR